ncbi:S-adenosyl-L-methionine-dependent methyltransferase, partial [Ascoidea rubescens DSM 1968]
MASYGDFQFIATPASAVRDVSSTQFGIRTTDYPAIKNAPLPADGPSTKHFSNLVLIGLALLIPYYIKYKLGGGLFTFVFFFILTIIPVLMAYWTVMSNFSPRLNEKVTFPGKNVEDYLEFHTDDLKQKYSGSNKIPWETFHELYFDGKVSFKGDALQILEYRHDWSKFSFTLSLFRYFLIEMIPEVILHTRSQDEEQVRDHYDRGDDFYTWFLGPRMVYTSGVISDITREETLEEMQDNKLKIVCEKINLKKGERLLDLGCGWGTLAAFASSQYGARVTGITLGVNQTKWGNNQLAHYGVSKDQSEILCLDYRDTPVPQGGYNKITCLEMAEHVGIRKFGSFLQQVYDMLDDDGLFFLQYAGIRKHWQYEDLIWGLFMNRYIFPGADASTPLDFVISKLEGTGFEVVSIDNIGVHYSGTLWRWYRNWLGNRDKVVNKYGIKWFRIWEFFLASSTIISRQGSATCYQIVLRKNINSYHRVEYIPHQKGLLANLKDKTPWF